MLIYKDKALHDTFVSEGACDAVKVLCCHEKPGSSALMVLPLILTEKPLFNTFSKSYDPPCADGDLCHYKGKENGNEKWIDCDNCKRWFHLECTGKEKGPKRKSGTYDWNCGCHFIRMDVLEDL